MEGSYLLGNREGLWTTWYLNGMRKEESNYTSGKLNGTIIRWYENGNKSENGVYETGKQNGIWIPPSTEHPEDGDLVSVRIRNLSDEDSDENTTTKPYEFILGNNHALPEIEKVIKSLNEMDHEGGPEGGPEMGPLPDPLLVGNRLQRPPPTRRGKPETSRIHSGPRVSRVFNTYRISDLGSMVNYQYL